MQRFTSHLGIPVAALAIAMLVGVQFGHSPLHHVAEHVAAHAAESGHQAGHHHHGSGCHHHHGPADHSEHGDHTGTPLGHHDHDSECHLCDLALSPATLTTAATLEHFELHVAAVPQLAQSVLETAERWTVTARGPPASQA